MRDFRDAKSMARTLREALRHKQLNVPQGESLEIIAKMLGAGDWNTLSAAIKGSGPSNEPAQASRKWLPALPIKDTAPFPGAEMPFWLKRAGSIKALEAAHAGGRQVVLVTQRAADVEAPSLADVYAIGVTGRVLDIGAPAEGILERDPTLEGSTQVLVQTHQRVMVLGLSANKGGYEAKIEKINEGPLREDPALVRDAIDLFESYASKRRSPGRNWPTIRQLHDPGRIADVVAQSLMLSVDDKQSLLAKVDATKRLQAVMRHLEPA